MLTVHVPLGGSGAARQFPSEMVNRGLPAAMPSAVIVRFPGPAFVMVTRLVTGARDVGILNVNVPPPIPPVAFVALVNRSLPCGTPLPVSATGEPVTATFALMRAVPCTVPVPVAVNTMLIVQLVDVAGGTGAANVVPHVPGFPAGTENGAVTKVPLMLSAAVPVLVTVNACATL